MSFFTIDEFLEKYPLYTIDDFETWQIEAVSEMIFSQIGLKYRDSSWTNATVPTPIKNASMEQLRFMLDHSIPFVDYNKKIKAGSMEAELNSDYSTLALRILSNNGYLYRGNPMNANMKIKIPFGG